MNKQEKQTKISETQTIVWWLPEEGGWVKYMVMEENLMYRV